MVLLRLGADLRVWRLGWLSEGGPGLGFLSRVDFGFDGRFPLGHSRPEEPAGLFLASGLRFAAARMATCPASLSNSIMESLLARTRAGVETGGRCSPWGTALVRAFSVVLMLGSILRAH